MKGKYSYRIEHKEHIAGRARPSRISIDGDKGRGRAAHNILLNKGRRKSPFFSFGEYPLGTRNTVHTDSPPLPPNSSRSLSIHHPFTARRNAATIRNLSQPVHSCGSETLPSRCGAITIRNLSQPEIYHDHKGVEYKSATYTPTRYGSWCSALAGYRPGQDCI